MAVQADENGILGTHDFGPEFSRGQEVHRFMTLRIGHGLYKGLDGRVHAYPWWAGTWFDRALLLIGFFVMFFAGYAFAAWREASDHTAWIIVAVIAAFVVGWWAHRTQPT